MVEPTLSERATRLVDLALEYVGYPDPIPEQLDADIALRDAALAVRESLSTEAGRAMLEGKG